MLSYKYIELNSGSTHVEYLSEDRATAQIKSNFMSVKNKNYTNFQTADLHFLL